MKLVFTNITPEFRDFLLNKIQQSYDNEELRRSNHIRKNGITYNVENILLEDTKNCKINYCNYCHKILPEQEIVEGWRFNYCNDECREESRISDMLDEQT